ncbi:MAG: LuxR C-terminal-related transcriptional regulator [Microlunatus sp.]|nr:LuxR C-terminal-related transcriptional regulator [Microlunatus sp.]
MLLKGEAGIGKSRLLQYALDEAAARGMTVLAGRARELESNRPFGLLADALDITASNPDPRRARIAAMLATHSDGERGPVTVTSDPGLQFRVVDAFGDLVEELALSRPLALGVDDLQWADPSSLLTIATTTRRLADLPVALIGCFRPAPREPMLEQLVAGLVRDGAQHVDVGALDDRAVHDLSSGLLAAEPGSNLLTQIAGTAGNPLFIHELLEVLVRDGDISIEDGLAETARTVLPASLRMTIVRQLSFLSRGTVGALTSASVLGSGFALADLSTITGRAAGDLSDSLSEAFQAQVLAGDDAGLFFRHDLIRDAIYEDLEPDIRRALHREAGQRLAARGAPTVQIAEQLTRGAAIGDAEAVDWLARAAREAFTSSPQIAAHLLQRAVALTVPTDPGRDRLLVEQAEATMWAGQVTQAQSLCQELLERRHDPHVEATALLCLGLALLSSGRPAEGLQQLERVARAPSVTEAERAASLAWASTALVWLGEVDRATSAAEQAKHASTTVGDHMSASIAVTMLSGIARLRGDLDRSLQLSDEALRIAQQDSAGRGHRYPVHAPRAYVLIELDRLEEARSAIESGMQLGEQFGTHWPGYQIVRALERYTAGEWSEAVAEIETMTERATDTGEAYGLAIALNVLAVINLHRNELDRAEAAVQAATGEAERAGVRASGYWAQWAGSILLESLGHTNQAYLSLCGVWQRCTDLGSLLEYRVFGADLVRLSLATGNPGRAQQAAAAVAELAARNDVPSLQAMALRCRGLANDDARLLAQAAHLYAEAPRPLEHASACEDAGAAFLRQADVDTARPLLEQACRTYEYLEASRALARTEALLRSAGIRRGRRGRRGRPRTGWESLTASEHAVIDLVAEGLSNPQIGQRMFISRRTVQTHLAHVFAKLDLSSRTLLAAEVIRRRS